jgi:hypothetical protein
MIFGPFLSGHPDKAVGHAVGKLTLRHDLELAGRSRRAGLRHYRPVNAGGGLRSRHSGRLSWGWPTVRWALLLSGRLPWSALVTAVHSGLSAIARLAAGAGRGARSSGRCSFRLRLVSRQEAGSKPGTQRSRPEPFSARVRRLPPIQVAAPLTHPQIEVLRRLVESAFHSMSESMSTPGPVARLRMTCPGRW